MASIENIWTYMVDPYAEVRTMRAALKARAAARAAALRARPIVRASAALKVSRALQRVGLALARCQARPEATVVYMEPVPGGPGRRHAAPACAARLRALRAA